MWEIVFGKKEFCLLLGSWSTNRVIFSNGVACRPSAKCRWACRGTPMPLFGELVSVCLGRDKRREERGCGWAEPALLTVRLEVCSPSWLVTR